jgi:UDP-glucose 4-epimerase
MSKIVVTGASGFIGQHIMRELKKRNYEVVGLDIIPSKGVIACDITSKDIEKHIGKGDKVLHLAAVAKFERVHGNPTLGIRVNVEGTLNIIQTCIKKKANRLIFTSSGAVYRPNFMIPINEESPCNPTSLYGWSKKIAEDLIMFYGGQLPYIILRYGYIFGKGKDWGAIGSFVSLLKQGKPPTIFNGKQLGDFIYIRDVVEMTMLALETEHTREIFNVGSGTAWSIREVFNRCCTILNVKVEPKIVPLRDCDSTAFLYDMTKAKKLLDFTPQWNLTDGLYDMVYGD